MGSPLLGLKIRGIRAGDAVPDLFTPKLVALHRRGRFPFDWAVIFHDFDQIDQAVEDSEKDRAIESVPRLG